MRSEPAVREEIRLILERGRVALGVDAEQVVGNSDSKIVEVMEVQGVSVLPPPLDEFLRWCGGAGDKLLAELFPGTGIGAWEMINFGKSIAAQTVEINGSGEVFGSDRVVFRTHPNGDVYWLETGEVDPPVFYMTESSPEVRVIYARLAHMLEQRVLHWEFKAAGRPVWVNIYG